MTSELDIYRSAQVFIRQYGENAPRRAARQAADFQAKGDDQGHAVWLRISKAAVDLLRQERPDGAALH